MVKLIMLMLSMIFPDFFNENAPQEYKIGLNTDLLITRDNQEAKTIIEKFQSEGYDVRILEISQTIRMPIRTPFLIIRENGVVTNNIIGLHTEKEYRALIPFSGKEDYPLGPVQPPYNDQNAPCGAPGILWFGFLGSDTELLVTSRYCTPCKEAVLIIERLQEQGYDVKIIDMHGEQWERDIANDFRVTKVPTLIVRTNKAEYLRLVGLRSEGKYRSVISKILCAQEPINLDNFTGAINFTNGTEPRTLVYNGIVRRAKRSPYGYLEHNPDNRTDLATQYKITKLPTLLLLKSGVEIGRYIGITPYVNN